MMKSEVKICGKTVSIEQKENLMIVECCGETSTFVIVKKQSSPKTLYSLPVGKYLGIYDVDLCGNVTVPPGGGFSVSFDFPRGFEVVVDNEIFFRRNCNKIKRTYIESLEAIGGYVPIYNKKMKNMKLIFKNNSTKRAEFSHIVIPSMLLSIDKKTGKYKRIYVILHDASIEMSNENYKRGVLLPKSFIF